MCLQCVGIRGGNDLSNVGGPPGSEGGGDGGAEEDVTMEEEYEGDLDERRRITTQYDFNVKSYVFGERKRSNVILYTESTFFELVGDNYLNAGPTGAISRVDVGVSGDH